MLTSLKRHTINLSTVYFPRSLLLGSIGLTLIFVMANLALSWTWLNRPFAGFLHRNLAVTEGHLPGWPARETIIKQGDVIVTVNGRRLSPTEWLDYLHQQAVGQPISYSILNEEGQIIEISLPVSLFTARDFSQLVVTPVFIALIALITAGVVAYFRSHLLAVKLFSLFTLAMVFFVASLPDFVMGNLFSFNFIGAAVGGILMPPLLLHFLFLFPYQRKILKTWPFLLPLIYLPILPALIYLPTLVDQPETIRNFERGLYIYMAIYTMVGLFLLLEAAIRADNSLHSKQAIVLLMGFTLPTSLFILNVILVNPIIHMPIRQILERYAFVGVPIAVAFAIVRCDMFGIDRSNRWHISYLEAIGIVLAGYVLFVLFIDPPAINFSWTRPQSLIIIGCTIVGFFVLRPLYNSGRHWLEHHLQGSVEDFRIGLRIFSHELIKVKSRHDLETLVSWEIPTGFRLRSAELAPDNMPNSPFSLRLPLNVSNISLGTLFLGEKTDGKSFTKQEQVILSELQKQISLVVWSLALDEAIQAIEELTSLKSKFLANVTHELRTPLNGIINYIGFVLDDDVGSLNKEQTGHLNRALQGAEKLLEIINNILDMSKIEAGQMTLYIQPVNLTSLVTEIIPVVEEILDNKPITIIAEISPELPILYGDRLRLRQIMLNIFSNAAKFTKVGTVRLNLYSYNGQMIIKISDTGRGIEESVLPTIFQQFTSTGLTDVGQAYGPGLGMPITKSLVELHGGQIEVESQVKKGTTFTVTLPINRKQA